MLKRVIAHWTAGTHTVSDTDKAHYHFLYDGDGKEYEGDFTPEANIAPKKGKYAAHTLNCNSGSIGMSCAAMAGAVENKTNGKFPLNERQFEAMCKGIARECEKYDIPVTRETVLSHAEVQPTLGIKQRGKWDIAVLPWNGIKGPIACGDYMRNRVLHYMGVSKPVKAAKTAYRVESGDTLWAISRKLGVPVSALLLFNKLQSDDILIPGQELKTIAPITVPDSTSAKVLSKTAAPLLGGLLTGIGGRIAKGAIEGVMEEVLRKNVKADDVPIHEGAVKPIVEQATPKIAEALRDEITSMKNYAENTEPWYQSFLVTGGLTGYITAGGLVVKALSDGYQHEADWEFMAAFIGLTIGFGIQMYGRYFKRKPIGE